MSNYLKQLIVKPGSKIRLKHFDPGYDGKHESRKSALPEIEENRQKMEQLQYRMYAENKHSLLIVLQGLDAAGKDGVVRHVLTGMNPSGCVSVNFKQPTAKELAHDFLWRVHPHVPAKGSVAIFNRSHYEDVLVARVHGLVPEKVWSKRYDQINDWFEGMINQDSQIFPAHFERLFDRQSAGSGVFACRAFSRRAKRAWRYSRSSDTRDRKCCLPTPGLLCTFCRGDRLGSFPLISPNGLAVVFVFACSPGRY